MAAKDDEIAAMVRTELGMAKEKVSRNTIPEETAVPRLMGWKKHLKRQGLIQEEAGGSFWI